MVGQYFGVCGSRCTALQYVRVHDIRKNVLNHQQAGRNTKRWSPPGCRPAIKTLQQASIALNQTNLSRQRFVGTYKALLQVHEGSVYLDGGHACGMRVSECISTLIVFMPTRVRCCRIGSQTHAHTHTRTCQDHAKDCEAPQVPVYVTAELLPVERNALAGRCHRKPKVYNSLEIHDQLSTAGTFACSVTARFIKTKCGTKSHTPLEEHRGVVREVPGCSVMIPKLCLFFAVSTAATLRHTCSRPSALHPSTQRSQLVPSV